MYYDEAIVDGVLSYRTIPEGPYTPFTAKELTEKFAGNVRVKTQPEYNSEFMGFDYA